MRWQHSRQMTSAGASLRPVSNDLLAQFDTVRARSVEIAAPLSAEDSCAQSMPDASPIKWHLAHTSWFFETFLLERFEADFTPHHPAFRALFNSYYDSIGDRHARPQRGLLTRPSLSEVLQYRQAVDARVRQQLANPSTQVAAMATLGLQHEQQHQELMLTDVCHLLSMNPLAPAYDRDGPVPPATSSITSWRQFSAGVIDVGYSGTGFCFDHELPRHRQFVERFAIASKLISNANYLAFIEDGGYRNSSLWLAEGWQWITAQGFNQPLYWRCIDKAWHQFTLRGLQPLALSRPVMHLSFFEAYAYARWAGARLPTEAEWEHAVAAGAFGSCWQWTSSSYGPYPGYRPVEGACGEYNGKFMANQFVLRGSSFLTPAGHARRSYRNFFPATARWQCSGLRLAMT